MLALMPVMLLALVAAAQMKDPMVGGQEMFPTKNIVENAVNSADHTTLVAAVKAAGLVDTLEGPGPFTVFAPTNEAFGKLPAGTVDTLLKPENKDTLTKVLTYHVVAGRWSSADLMNKIKRGSRDRRTHNRGRRKAPGPCRTGDKSCSKMKRAEVRNRN